MVYIFCQNEEQYRSFLTQYYIRQGNPNYRRIRRAEDLRGTSNPPVIYYGTPEKREDYQGVVNMFNNRSAVILRKA